MIFRQINSYFSRLVAASLLLISLAVILLIISLVGSKEPNSDTTLKIGVTAGPHAIIMEEIKKHAKKDGIHIEIIEFNDFILPNASLDQGDLDANSYQHGEFLKEQIKSRGYHLVSLGETVTMPLGVYSKKHKAFDKIEEKAVIAIPNDPTNEARALRLLENTGLIKLKADVPYPVLIDIIENPKNLKILAIDAPQLPLSLKDVDLAVINTDWILLAGEDLSLGIFWEDPDRAYANIFVVREADKDKPLLKKVLQIYQSKEIRDFIFERFKGAVIPAWSYKKINSK